MSDNPRRPTRHWNLERTAPPRSDAEGLFVPCTDLPDASVGDTVTVTGHDADGAREGTIAELDHRGDEAFFRLELEP